MRNIIVSILGDLDVHSFYQNCEVLVTRATGFLGKLTVEKVLRSCPGVRRVHLLVRTKKGLSVEQRKKVLLDNVISAAGSIAVGQYFKDISLGSEPTAFNLTEAMHWRPCE
ncbi:hypothetical protein PR048_022881 [Dryococelus australis]|uniref:Fatty acyl-CoA reductase n=1 Tax=Dryococelus australis TaxID=614101 RepID=A0ABQ9GSH0_9NEOP|nr:hypothetical protein PR048_022881 [Dryococelus australis]